MQDAAKNGFRAVLILAGAHRTDLPKPRMAMLAPAPLTALDERGALREEVKPILDLIAEHDVVLSGGHLSIAEIFAVFEEARRRGVRRLLVNHPTFLIGASHADIRRLVEMGAYIEHSISMFVPGSKGRIYEPKDLKELIAAGTVERTILWSDLGQAGNCLPSVGFREVVGICLELGYGEADIRRPTDDQWQPRDADRPRRVTEAIAVCDPGQFKHSRGISAPHLPRGTQGYPVCLPSCVITPRA